MILNDNIKKKLVMAYNAYIRRSKSEVRVMEILENCVMKSRFFVWFFLSRSLTYIHPSRMPNVYLCCIISIQLSDYNTFCFVKFISLQRPLHFVFLKEEI